MQQGNFFHCAATLATIIDLLLVLRHHDTPVAPSHNNPTTTHQRDHLLCSWWRMGIWTSMDIFHVVHHLLQEGLSLPLWVTGRFLMPRSWKVLWRRISVWMVIRIVRCMMSKCFECIAACHEISHDFVQGLSRMGGECGRGFFGDTSCIAHACGYDVRAMEESTTATTMTRKRHSSISMCLDSLTATISLIPSILKLAEEWNKYHPWMPFVVKYITISLPPVAASPVSQSMKWMSSVSILGKVPEVIPPLLFIHRIDCTTIPFTAMVDAAHALWSCGAVDCEQVYLEKCDHQDVVMYLMVGGVASDWIMGYLLMVLDRRGKIV